MQSIELKIGTTLMAINECEMYLRDGNALIVGKEYIVNGLTESGFFISSELYEVHEFETNELNHYFRIVGKEKKTAIEQYIEFLEELKQDSFEESKKMILNNDNSEVANSLYMAYSIALTKAKQLLY